jgi:hypothetical protein
MILLADLHLDRDTVPILLDEVLPDIKTALERSHADKACLAILGDVFHVRHVVEVEVLLAFQKFLDEVTFHGNVVLLAGNHDMLDQTGRTVLSLFAGECVAVISTPMHLWGSFWVPYQHDPSYFSSSDFVKCAAGADFVFAHQGFRGAWASPHYRDVNGVDPSGIATPIFSGHYHQQQTVGGVTYVGAPYQTNANDEGNPSGYWIRSGSSFDFVECEWGRQFVTVDAVAGEIDNVTAGEVMGKHVRVWVRPEDAEEAVRALHERGCDQVTVLPHVDPIEARMGLPLGAETTHRDFAAAFIDSQSLDGLSKEDLLSVFDEITKQYDDQKAEP